MVKSYMGNPSSFLALAALGAILSLCGAKPATDDKPPKSAIPYTGLDAEQLKALIRNRFDVIPWNGKPFRYAELLQLSPGKQPGTLKSISFNPDGGGNARTLQAKALKRLVAGERIYDVIPARGQKNAFLLVDTKNRNILVDAKLKSDARRLLPVPSTEERETAIQEDKEQLKKVNEVFSDGRFEMVETKHFLFCSDLPERVLAQVKTTLEKTYSTMEQKLIPDEENLFRGKTMIVLFSTSDDLASYGKREMDRVALNGSRLITHRQPNGDDQFAACLDDDANETVTHLARISAYAILDRYCSDVHLPSWIQEGIAQWATDSVLPGNKNSQSRARQAAEALREKPSLGDFFAAKQFDAPWQASVAGSLVDILIKTDSHAFHDFILQIKEGVPWREALKYNFDLTPDDLTQQYGRQIGMPDLRS